MMKVALGALACSGIETHLGSDIPAGVRTAMYHYTSKLKSGRPPLDPPRFLPDFPAEEPRLAFDLTIDAETEQMLEQEAARQGTTLTAIASHAVLVLLAELDFVGAPARSSLSAPL
jgi:hypothetical protein